jgi:LysM repeat protein
MARKRLLWVTGAACLLLVVGTVPVLAQAQTHTVQPGETLTQIAVRYGVTVEQLASVNGIVNPNMIYVGQILVIPGAGGASTGQAYQVQQGDTLYRIAQQFGTTVDHLVALNGIANPNVLYVGQMLVISPASAASSTGATPATSVPSPAPTTSTHTVARGETLYLIALRYGTTIQTIALLNGLTNPNLIFPGQALLIPGAAASSEVAEAAAATATATATPSPTNTSLSAAIPTTAPVLPTYTPTFTVVPSPTLTPADVVPVSAPNRLLNPSFEGGVRAVRFGEVNVFESWWPFYCDNTTVPGGCPALRIGPDENPPGLMMGRPEYKPTNVSNRVHSGATAQQWFCFSRVCRAGVYQTFDTTPGALCEVGAYVQSWSTSNASVTGWHSQLTTQDDRDNATWQIVVDLNGGTNPFTGGNLLTSGTFGYDYEPQSGYNRAHGGHGVYDQYVPIHFTFIATGSRTTVFFQDTRLWPVTNNDSYIDDAWARCTY